MIARLFIVGWCLVATAACATQTVGRLRVGDRVLRVIGLADCDERAEGEVVLDPDRPLTLLVHGCNASAGQFKTLAQVFEAHGQQTMCFGYDDRDSLVESSAQLLTALDTLADNLRTRDLTILGHSQGGLVVRRALVQERADGAQPRADLRLRLVTISSPFAGIEAASHCGSLVLHILTFGISAAICQAVTGDKWMEIHPSAWFVVSPGSLDAQVGRHVMVVTNESHTCLRQRADGSCAESDFIFSVEEQYNPYMAHDRRMSSIEVDAGHSAIVGLPDRPPLALIAVLQAQGILAPTPPEAQAAVANLLARLYR